VFATDDPNERERFLKYTPEHMHCNCVFYGPMVPPNSGVLGFLSSSEKAVGFRIGLTGTVLETQSTPSVVKKLKLVGYPKKIFRNTAFITGMFNSALEAAKFEGARIKTVSGIRGQIKKSASGGEPGMFRATFEDKILMSDIVVCRMWVPVDIKDYYNPMMSLLATKDAVGDRGSSDASNESSANASAAKAVLKQVADQGSVVMRTISEMRREDSVPIPVNKDSLYRPVVREERVFKKLSVPKKLQEQLPFKSKPKLNASNANKKRSYMYRRTTVVEPEDRAKRATVQMLSTIAADKITKRKSSRAERSQTHKKSKEKVSEVFAGAAKEEKKRKYRDDGKMKVARDRKKQKI
jgi:ribosome biogenesis protein BMS1